MSRFYAVELRTVAIIQVDDPSRDCGDAEIMADDMQSDILSDAKHMSIEFNCVGEIKSLADLARHGWDGACIPYGGDGNTRLETLLPAATGAKP